MYKLKFSDFMDGNYDEKIDYETSLYLIRNCRDEVLYIGYSDRGIWNRWFSPGFVGHIQQNVYGELYGQSWIGKEILKNSPESGDWIIELWARDECLEKFSDTLKFKNKDAVPTHWIEAEMIRTFMPKLNINNNPRYY